MTEIAEKYRSTIDEAVEHLVSRAVNARGLSSADIAPRVIKALGKYLFVADQTVDHSEIAEFVGELRSDDLCLILACEKGDAAAWEDLVAGFDATVRSAARKITSNSEDADDLASSIWAELYGLRTDADGNKKSKLAYYSGRGSLGGWLRAVVAQLAVDEFRKGSKFVQVEEDRNFDGLAAEASENGRELFASHSDDPEKLFGDAQTSGDVAKALAAAIQQLASEDRLILKMYYFDDLKLKDIAATFGFHEATASRKLTRIQSEIRKGVEKELKTRHGWTDTEVARHLSDTATGLGINIETMFAAMLAAVFVQELITSGVL